MERCYVVTANPVRAMEQGFAPDHVIAFPSWVSGRFSAWGLRWHLFAWHGGRPLSRSG